MKPLIAITMGDFNGVGPEICLRSVMTPAVRNICSPLLVGSPDVFEWYARRLSMRIMLKEIDRLPFEPEAGTVPVINPQQYESPVIHPGFVSKSAGHFAGEAIERAAGLASKRLVTAMVTAPVSKEALHLSGFRFPGQTEMLAARTKTRSATMMLIGKQLRVALATVHVPLSRASKNISASTILRKLMTMNDALKGDFAIKKPRIAILGLNPHAGESGHIGSEEKQQLGPAIRAARLKGIFVEGPFPADGFFGMHAYKNYDALLAMYHDQGLIPFKMMSFDIGVNFSAGLPIVRTSPDHGTAFDIAGKGIASPTSMIQAIKLAVVIAHNRRRPRR